jgi:hypothetical protein
MGRSSCYVVSYGFEIPLNQWHFLKSYVQQDNAIQWNSFSTMLILPDGLFPLTLTGQGFARISHLPSQEVGQFDRRSRCRDDKHNIYLLGGGVKKQSYPYA